MVTSVKQSLLERDMKELMVNVISCIVCVYNGKATERGQTTQGTSEVYVRSGSE